MKHTTPDLMKFKKLRRRLEMPLYAVVGLLETLWIVTQKNAPCGDLGRFDDEEIAIELGWEGDPEVLISALVELEWLDQSETHRLVVHDWPAHAPRYIHGVVSKKGGFVEDYSDSLQSATIDGDCTRQQPNLTKPNLTYYRRALGGDSDDRGGIAYEEIAAASRKLLHDLGGRSTRRDRRLVLVCVGLKRLGYLPDDCLRKAMETVRDERPKNPIAYFRAIVARGLHENGHNLNQAITDATIPDDLLDLPVEMEESDA